MAKVVIELEGMLVFTEQEGGLVQSAIDIGEKALDQAIAKRLGLPLVRGFSAPGCRVGPCKLRLEIEPDE